MLNATEIRVGNILKIDGKPCRVLSHEIRGTGKFGKMVHLKLKGLEDGHIHEKSLRAEDKAEEVDVQRVKMQYLYREKDQRIFMNMETYEQFSLLEKTIGKQAAFLKENLEIDVLFAEGKPLSIDFPKVVELAVKTAPPPIKGGSDSTYKEVELENGLKILVPQFVKEGEKVRVNIEDLSYLDRVTTKSLKNEPPPKSKPAS
ncbi:MAG: elongation factor P [Candidatus Omnitrophica bacterium]|nr:elongation factor P [Candidatus Omnitrophota bacterium]